MLYHFQSKDKTCFPFPSILPGPTDSFDQTNAVEWYSGTFKLSCKTGSFCFSLGVYCQWLHTPRREVQAGDRPSWRFQPQGRSQLPLVAGVTAVNLVIVGSTLSPVHFSRTLGLLPPSLFCRGILQARILEWVAVSLPRGCSWPRPWTCVSCTAGEFFTTEPLVKPHVNKKWSKEHPGWALPEFLAQKTLGNYCCFKPLHFCVFCYITIESWAL